MFKHLRLAAFALAALAFSLPALATDLPVDGNLRFSCGTVASTGNGAADTATLNNKCGVVTSESLTTLAGSTFTLTLTNSTVTAGDIALVNVSNGTNTGGNPFVATAATSASTLTVIVKNGQSAVDTGLLGTIKINYLIVKP